LLYVPPQTLEPSPCTPLGGRIPTELPSAGEIPRPWGKRFQTYRRRGLSTASRQEAHTITAKTNGRTSHSQAHAIRKYGRVHRSVPRRKRKETPDRP